MCQKIVNVLAVASAVVSAAVVGSGLYVYVNRVSIIDGVKSQVLDSVTGSLGGGLGGSLGGTLPTGSNDLSPTAPDQASANPSTGFGIPQ